MKTTVALLTALLLAPLSALHAAEPPLNVLLIHEPKHQALVKKYQDRLRQWMIETHDHCLAAFDVRESPAKLAEAVKNYPVLDKSGGTATEAGEEPVSKPSATDDKVAKCKANRAAKKEAGKTGSGCNWLTNPSSLPRATVRVEKQGGGRGRGIGQAVAH